MSTAVVITDHKADKDRQGVILDSENNLVSRFGWFPLAYGHQVAKGFGLEQAAVATPGHFNVIVADATARAEASGKVQVKGEVAIVGEG